MKNVSNGIKRVFCLYRVSTDGQVEYRENIADIPMQRNECRRFVSRFPKWKILREFVEDGISGRKVSAANRDAIQEIRIAAERKEFDVLLVYMFDRLGRIANETPFIVEGLTKLGIEVWSVTEGQQTFDNDVDHLTNYIRFWKAESEANAISRRTKDGLRNLVESGYFKGGIPPYGYDLMQYGRKNKRGRAVYDLVVNETEADVVRLIFSLYIHQKMGTWQIKTYLSDHGYKTKSRNPWSASSVRRVLQNEIYIGILRCGERRSDIISELVIIDSEIFEKAQELFKKRRKQRNLDKPLSGKSGNNTLLNGLVFCGHCKSRLNITTGGSYYKRKDGTKNTKRRIRYSCYGKRFHITDCDGQTGYTASKLDPIIEDIIREIFAKAKELPEYTAVSHAIQEQEKKSVQKLQKMKRTLSKTQKELSVLKGEIVKAIEGTSPYTSETLAELIREKNEFCDELREDLARYKEKVEDQTKVIKELRKQYNQLISYAEIYDCSEFNVKRKILTYLIERIEVRRGYEVEINFSINLEQFNLGLDL